jgi:copper chaperone
MKTLSLLSVLFCLGSYQALACEGHGAGAKSADKGKPSMTLVKSEADGQAGMSKATFQVKGMMCGSCEKNISASLKKVEGVKTISFGKKDKAGLRLAVITYDGNVASEQLVKAVQDAGYSATTVQ